MGSTVKTEMSRCEHCLVKHKIFTRIFTRSSRDHHKIYTRDLHKIFKESSPEVIITRSLLDLPGTFTRSSTAHAPLRHCSHATPQLPLRALPVPQRAPVAPIMARSTCNFLRSVCEGTASEPPSAASAHPAHQRCEHPRWGWALWNWKARQEVYLELEARKRSTVHPMRAHPRTQTASAVPRRVLAVLAKALKAAKAQKEHPNRTWYSIRNQDQGYEGSSTSERAESSSYIMSPKASIQVFLDFFAQR